MAFGFGSIFDAMVTRGWTTLGAFAFSCFAQPGVTSPTGTDVFYTEVASDLVDGNVNSPLAPGLRRLFFESWTCSSADLKHRMEKRDDEPPRKMPAVEREDRRRRLQERLGITMRIEGLREPSNALVDYVADMYEDNVFRYVGTLPGRSAPTGRRRSRA